MISDFSAFECLLQAEIAMRAIAMRAICPGSNACWMRGGPPMRRRPWLVSDISFRINHEQEDCQEVSCGPSSSYGPARPVQAAARR